MAMAVEKRYVEVLLPLKLRKTLTYRLPDELLNGWREGGVDSGDEDGLGNEVGSGTGQATEPVLKTGCELTAVEYGVNLSEVLKAKFRDYQNFHVVTARFEDAELEEDAYDLVSAKYR